MMNVLMLWPSLLIGPLTAAHISCQLQARDGNRPNIPTQARCQT
jgi:hypothetical protein